VFELAKILTASIAVMTFTHSASAKELKMTIPVEKLGMEPFTVSSAEAGLKMDIQFDVLRQAANTWFDTLI
jgi:hypothetical protein